MTTEKLLKRCGHCKNKGIVIYQVATMFTSYSLRMDRCPHCIHGKRKQKRTIEKVRKQLEQKAFEILESI